MKLLNMFNWVEGLVKFFTLYGGGGDGGGGGTTQSTSYSTNLPEYAQPYYQELMKQTGKQIYTTNSSGTVTGVKDMPTYTGERLAGFTPEQLAVQRSVAGLKSPTGFSTAGTQFGKVSSLSGIAGAGGLADAFAYNPSTFRADTVLGPSLTNYQMAMPENVYAPSTTAYQMTGPAAVKAAALRNYGMSAAPNVVAERAASSTFTPSAARAYMSPYQSAVTDIAVREARKQADIDKAALASGAIGRGTFGGARQALLQAEQGRGSALNIADIRARGQQAAYENAQKQFEADQARRMAAQQLNVQSGLQAGLANQQAQQQARVQNLAAQLQTQGLSADQAMKAALANQQAQQQTAEQNLAARLGVQQLTTGQKMQAALANQQARQAAAQANLQAKLGVQQLGSGQRMQAALANQQARLEAQKASESARQYQAGLGKDIGLAGLQQQLEAAKATGALAATQQTADLQRLQAQATSAAEKQALQQKIDDLKYQTFMEKQNYQKAQLDYLSNILRGNAAALGSTQVQYTPTPSTVSQIAGLGLGGLGLVNALK